jgi:membrane protein DedA with SNARE-associated domain
MNTLSMISRDVVEPMLALLRNHADWAPLIVLGIMVLEGVIVTTFLFSAVVVSLATGVLIHNGALPYGPMFLAIFTGFWIGDTINFMIGYRGDSWFRSLNAVKKRPKLVAKAEALIENWGWAAIFISRFMGPSRPFVTFLAGACHMRHLQFHIATAVSTLLLTWGLLNAGITGAELWGKSG